MIPKKPAPREGGGCRLFGPDHAQKKHDPEKAGRDRPKAEDQSAESITTGGGYAPAYPRTRGRARLRFAEPAIGRAKGETRWAPRNDNLEVGEHSI
jgi:hypothetical protein